MTRFLPPLSLTGAHILRNGAMQYGAISLAEGRITGAALPNVDLSGYLILPGIIDLHGDGFEHHMAPRPSAPLPFAAAFVYCEAAAFRQLGGFSHELFASEEIEFSQRLKKLARQQGKKMVILHRHPLVTSARKMHLYSNWEHLRFLGKTVLTAGGTLRTRDTCTVWYDGRR